MGGAFGYLNGEVFSSAACVAVFIFCLSFCRLPFLKLHLVGEGDAIHKFHWMDIILPITIIFLWFKADIDLIPLFSKLLLVVVAIQAQVQVVMRHVLPFSGQILCFFGLLFGVLLAPITFGISLALSIGYTAGRSLIRGLSDRERIKLYQFLDHKLSR